MKEPLIFPINQLPQFIQIAVADLWEKNGIDPKDMERRNLVFTYFEGIYTATPMPTHLFIHESVHYVRQGSGESKNQAKDWWIRFCSDPEFRYQEELLAYREQYRYILHQLKNNKAVAFNEARILAADLSGQIYGNLRGLQTALSDIISK